MPPEADLFGQSARVDEDDDLFGKPGGLFSSSKGLFDDDDDDDNTGVRASSGLSTLLDHAWLIRCKVGDLNIVTA